MQLTRPLIVADMCASWWAARDQRMRFTVRRLTASALAIGLALLTVQCQSSTPTPAAPSPAPTDGPGATSTAPEPAPTVQPSGRTAGELARRGDQVYKESCGRCHDDPFAGPLSNGLRSYGNARDLFPAKQTKMPQDRPGSLPEE